MHEAVHPDPSGAAGTGAEGLDDIGLRVEIADRADGAVVALRGELDLATAPELQRELFDVLARGVSALTLDLSAVTFLDSSGLGTLYRTQQAADERGIPLRLTEVPAHVMRVLDVTAMTPIFDLDARDD